MATPIPQNQAEFSLSDVLAATHGRIQGVLEPTALRVRGVTTDTRALQPEQAFVALVGERFDGHEHVAEAAARGARLVVVQRDVVVPSNTTVLRVESTLAALGALAAFHLERWRAAGDNRRVVALTGSAGKTTTKRAIAALLEAVAPGRVCTAAGNLNNLVGMPMTLLTLTDQHRVAVLEMGTNAPGEIAKLARIARPDVGLITLIASAHSEGLGGIDAIAEEKGALFRELRSVAIGNMDDDRVRERLLACRDLRQVGYGRHRDASYRIVNRRVGADLVTSGIEVCRSEEVLAFDAPLVGEAGALACAAAIAAAVPVAWPISIQTGSIRIAL